ncbi:hypothetical protein [Tenacibaculum piscium]|uniref:hypothetical protein n=1 Tax=Tenacibaculum piscium TaxID=1458515 RepID=UPI0023B8CBEF|nr:hypothetical protein [Tenacibaculum piscium]
MKYIEFDTGLNGGLNGACASEDYAKQNELKTRSVLAQKDEAQRKYDALKNGDLQKMWNSNLIEIANQEKVIKAEKLKLQQEKTVADSLGLGWFGSKLVKNIGKSVCKKSIKRNERAINSLADAENLLGNIQGAYYDKFLQLKEGKIENQMIISKNKETIAQIQKELQAVKTKIANYKIERDNIKRAEAQTQAQAQANASVTAPKVNSAGILSKKNLPILAGVLFLGGVLYFSKNGKKPRPSKRKK